jgi:cytoskeletal protein CcmA (bactofilin family)
MSETMNDAVTMARRTASQSVTLFKSAAGFKAKDEPAMPSEPANEAAPTRIEVTAISAKTEMKGSINTPDELHIHGKIEGDVRAAKIVIGATGAVKGDVMAESVIVHGVVEGRVHGQHVRLWAGASVRGEVTHGSLGIDTAALFEGSVKRIEAAAIAAE